MSCSLSSTRVGLSLISKSTEISNCNLLLRIGDTHMAYDITLIPGDGIGPEVTEAAKRVLEATGVTFHWDLAYAGGTAQDMFGTPLPDYVLESIRKNKVAFKGPVTTPVGSGFRSVNVALRKALDLYVGLRHCKSFPGVRAYQNVDIVVIRENTEDMYVGIEYMKGSPELAKLLKFVAETGRGPIKEDSSISLRTISETGSRRIARFAFEYARTNKRRKVPAVH